MSLMATGWRLSACIPVNSNRSKQYTDSIYTSKYCVINNDISEDRILKSNDDNKSYLKSQNYL